MSIVLYAGHHDCHERWLRRLLRYTPTLVISSFPFTLLRIPDFPCSLVSVPSFARCSTFTLSPLSSIPHVLHDISVMVDGASHTSDPGLVFLPCTLAIPSSVLFHMLLRCYLGFPLCIVLPRDYPPVLSSSVIHPGNTHVDVFPVHSSLNVYVTLTCEYGKYSMPSQTAAHTTGTGSRNRRPPSATSSDEEVSSDLSSDNSLSTPPAQPRRLLTQIYGPVGSPSGAPGTGRTAPVSLPTQTPGTGRTNSVNLPPTQRSSQQQNADGMPPPGAMNEPPTPATTTSTRGRGSGNRGKKRR